MLVIESPFLDKSKTYSLIFIHALSFNDRSLVLGEIHVLHCTDATHLLNSLLQLLNGELIHIGLVFVGPPHEVGLIVVVVNTIRSINQIIEQGLLAGS